MSEGTTIVRGAWALTMGPAGAIREGAVAFDGDGAISAVGPADQLIAADPGAELVGDGNGIVLPGFVNAHT
ncbi:MAG TPA: hypothetical protein PLJ64_11110, partial [Solirubrobacterales bacterium]|nr:hypothetical protein [Solirubrobacterales bacterium]